MRNFTYATVERIWPDSTVVLIASGPSLTVEDCEFVRGKARVIVINRSFERALWADAMFACDSRFWGWVKGAPEFHGLKFSLQQKAAKWPGVQILRRGSNTGLSLDPSVLNLGNNSGYQALNLAVLLGAKRILLLGYDMKAGPKGEKHWHKEHPIRTPDLYQMFRRNFATLEVPLANLGIQCINCSRDTALDCFPRMTIEEALGQRQEVAA